MDTLKEYENCVKSRMQPIDFKSLLFAIDSLGYEIDYNLSFIYDNTSNDISYKGKFIYVIQKDDGLSFSHINARRDDNFKKFQDLRLNSICMHRGYIIEF